MNLLEDAIIYATRRHRGAVRKIENFPYILHPLEVAQIISTMTDDVEVIAAGVLHDVVEDTDGTIDEIREQFGQRVADIVMSETENKYPGEDKIATWKRRKEESLNVLKHSKDTGVKMLWLADKLANLRSIVRICTENGVGPWEHFHQKDPSLHRWYYIKVAEYVEYDLNRTGAFKEYIKHINFMWPGSFDSEKTKYRKYKEVSIEGCDIIGKGAKGNVYRYDDETIIKVFSDGITYQDVEQETAISRKAFIMGLPTAISFGIVAVGKGYGAMFELIESSNISQYIARDPARVGYYAKLMADIAHQIHDTVSEDDSLPLASDMMRNRVRTGLLKERPDLAERFYALIDKMPQSHNLVHGDFHSNNVMLQNGEPIMIDLDRLSVGDAIVDLSGVYLSYIALGERDHSVVEKFMGFSYEKAQEFYRLFMESYLGNEYEDKIDDLTMKLQLISYARIIRRIDRHPSVSDEDRQYVKELTVRISDLLDKVTELTLL